MVNGSNVYAAWEPDFAASVAVPPQIEAALGTSRDVRERHHAKSGRSPRAPRQFGSEKCKLLNYLARLVPLDADSRKAEAMQWHRLQGPRLRCATRSCCRSATAAGR